MVSCIRQYYNILCVIFCKSLTIKEIDREQGVSRFMQKGMRILHNTLGQNIYSMRRNISPVLVRYYIICIIFVKDKAVHDGFRENRVVR